MQYSLKTFGIHCQELLHDDNVYIVNNGVRIIYRSAINKPASKAWNALLLHAAVQRSVVADGQSARTPVLHRVAQNGFAQVCHALAPFGL